MGTDETYDGAMRRTVAHELVSTELVRDCYRLAEKVGDALAAGEAPEIVAFDFACFAATWQLQALRTDLGDLIDDVGLDDDDITLPQTLRPDIHGSPQLDSDYLIHAVDDRISSDNFDAVFWSAFRSDVYEPVISDCAMSLEFAAA